MAPFLVEGRESYERVRHVRAAAQGYTDLFDAAAFHRLDGEVVARFHPKSLPPAEAMPAPELSADDASGQTSTTASRDQQDPLERVSLEARPASRLAASLLGARALAGGAAAERAS